MVHRLFRDLVDDVKSGGRERKSSRCLGLDDFGVGQRRKKSCCGWDFEREGEEEWGEPWIRQVEWEIQASWTFKIPKMMTGSMIYQYDVCVTVLFVGDLSFLLKLQPHRLHCSRNLPKAHRVVSLQVIERWAVAWENLSHISLSGYTPTRSTKQSADGWLIGPSPHPQSNLPVDLYSITLKDRQKCEA